MAAGSTDFYVAASLARWRATRCTGQAEVNEPGLRGLLGCNEDPRVRLLVTDDEAYTGLAARSSDLQAGMITVFATAARCVELLETDPAWRSSPATAMVCRDLATVSRLALPDTLALRAVRRVAEDPPDGVALKDAVAAVVIASPGEDPAALIRFLRSLPQTTQLFAAVDADGTVRATSGCQVTGDHARVIFVDTDPDWRRRGIAAAMTSVALQAAQVQGAREASLDASSAARSIYRRLGFESAGQTVRFTAMSRPRES